MYRLLFLLVSLSALLLVPHSVLAQSSLDLRGNVGGSGFPGGSVIPGYDSATCDGTIEGAIRYNSGSSCAEFCDGSTWTCPSDLSGPVDCPNIGDECTAQGNIIFAGYHPITHEHLFIPPTDQERPGSPGTFTMNWKNATGTNDIDPGSSSDGETNHTNRGGAIADFQAFQACEDLGFGSHNDWYLPSQVELYYLWAVHETIEAGGNITNFQNAIYWSSTQTSTNYAWTHNFGFGSQSYTSKTNGYRVRCVRR